eukprot:gnl/MRDRNA2_/MRDRNA2_88374_c0_seq1.p1 gnl/MRDRNA2_/MRDRNA2_88374_c0~~gnl/MRDRNA2_/MRDRNA2_88374_c0_seq1.p1  ORF type:complete len:121 (+),score=22.73 gnl/MRDRNA2_/MRDRNA2_88374_c0_seq1:100-462(+)
MVAATQSSQPALRLRVFLALQVLFFAMGFVVMVAICADPDTAPLESKEAGSLQVQQVIQGDDNHSTTQGGFPTVTELQLQENEGHEEKDCVRSWRSKAVLFSIAAAGALSIRTVVDFGVL